MYIKNSRRLPTLAGGVLLLSRYVQEAKYEREKDKVALDTYFLKCNFLDPIANRCEYAVRVVTPAVVWSSSGTARRWRPQYVCQHTVPCILYSKNWASKIRLLYNGYLCIIVERQQHQHSLNGGAGKIWKHNVCTGVWVLNQSSDYAWANACTNISTPTRVWLLGRYGPLTSRWAEDPLLRQNNSRHHWLEVLVKTLKALWGVPALDSFMCRYLPTIVTNQCKGPVRVIAKLGSRIRMPNICRVKMQGPTTAVASYPANNNTL